MTRPHLPVLVIGAGPAGLSAARELGRRGIAYRLIERGPTLGHSWAQLYDSLVLHTGRHMSALPGQPYPRGTSLFPTRLEFLRYLEDYARRAGLVVEAGVEARRVWREGDRWCAETADGRSIDARAVVVATGIIANPRVPDIPGREMFRGAVLHSVAYRRPEVFGGQRVLVVGIGNSGGEIASELGRAGVDVTVLARSGAHVVPRAVGGIPLQYLAYAIRHLPPGARRAILAQVQRLSERRHGPPVLPRPAHGPLDAIPLIGFALVDAIRAGLVHLELATIERLTAETVVFTDGRQRSFDTIVLATGFTPALQPLGALVRKDAKGFAQRVGRVTSADAPGLFFVGHNYDTTGGLANIRRDAPLVAAAIARV